MDALGHLVRLQVAAAVGAQFLLGGAGAGGGDEQQVDALPEHRVRDADGQAAGAGRVLCVRALHLKRRDLGAAAGNQLLLPADQFHHAVGGTDGGEITRAQPVSVHRGTGGGRVVQIAGHQMGGPQAQFTDGAGNGGRGGPSPVAMRNSTPGLGRPMVPAAVPYWSGVRMKSEVEVSLSP